MRLGEKNQRAVEFFAQTEVLSDWLML